MSPSLPVSASSPKISLCIIAGNVPHYITRFLDSFAPLVDEVNIVLATGAADSMATLTAASNWKDDRGVPGSVCEHYNAPAHDVWPHVDSFAAARNYAFSLASHDWILWADTDDVIDADSIATLRKMFEIHHASADCFSFEYHVPEDGLTVIKDRLVRRGSCQWRHRVHEELVFTCEKPRFLVAEGVRITHMPAAGGRAPNDERNLRLLECMEQEGSSTTGHRFHLMNTLRAVGRNDDSLRTGSELLKAPDLATPERCEVLLSLASMCDDLHRQKQLLLQVLAADPSRREPYGELAINACRCAQFGQMLAWTTAMRALPLPAKYNWNFRAQYYGWGGVQLHAVALRANNRRVTADVLQFNHFKAHGAKISLLHATRGRSKQALAAQYRWLNSAADPDAIEHIFAIDADDDQAMPLAANLSVILPGDGGCVAAWNAAAAKSNGALLVQMSDDWNPPMHWDKQILERLGDLSAPAVLAISDGSRTDDLLCMAILTRARYKQQGYLFHPRFKSMYSDNWFTRCAIRDGVIIEARDLVFEHVHPAFGKAEMDATYAASNSEARYAEGYDILADLLASENPPS